MKLINIYRDKLAVFFSSILMYFTLYSTSAAQILEPRFSIDGGSSAGSGQICSFVGIQNFKGLVTTLIGCFITPIAYLLVSTSIIVFTYGVFKFIRAEGDGKAAGREFMFYGIIGIFVMVSLWGLVNVLQNTFRLS